MWVWSLGQEDPLEGEKATHSGILAWKIPQTEEPGGLQFMGLQKSRTWLSHWAHVKRTFMWEIQSTLTPGLSSVTVSCVFSIYFFISFLEAESQTASQLELLDGRQDQQWWRRRSSPSYPPLFWCLGSWLWLLVGIVVWGGPVWESVQGYLLFFTLLPAGHTWTFRVPALVTFHLLTWCIKGWWWVSEQKN